MRKQFTLLAMAAAALSQSSISSEKYPKYDNPNVKFYPNADMGQSPFYMPTRSQRVKNKIRARQKNS